MIPDEKALRKAIAERIGRPSPDLQGRVLKALDSDKTVGKSFRVLAVASAVVVTASAVGLILLSRQAPQLEPSAVPIERVSGEIPSPVPCCSPYTAQLTAPSSNLVWALVDSVALYRSRDRGTTWEARPSLPSTRVSEISFLTDQQGWTLIRAGELCQREKAVLWRTLDAGTNWDMVASIDLGPGRCGRGLSFVNATDGFLGAWDQSSAPVIYRTNDGGRTWVASDPLPEPAAEIASPARSAARPLRPGWVRAFGSIFLVSAAGSSALSPEYVFRSTDGGADWTYVGLAPDLGTPVTFLTASRWLQLARPLNGNGLPGPPMETSDAGASWHAFSTDYWDTSGGPEIVFSGALVGYTSCPELCAGLKRTMDGGAHWTALETPVM